MAAVNRVSTIPVRARSSWVRLGSANERASICDDMDDARMVRSSRSYPATSQSRHKHSLRRHTTIFPLLLERCPQRELDLTRIIGLARYLSEQRPSKRRVGWGKLNPIEKIEEFCAEIETGPFGQASNFRHREIPIVDALGAQC